MFDQHTLPNLIEMFKQTVDSENFNPIISSDFFLYNDGFSLQEKREKEAESMSWIKFKPKLNFYALFI